MIPTNWYIITGAPCSGKTTTTQRLEQKGYAVRYEVTRRIIEDLIRSGQFRDERLLQRKILEAKVRVEQQTPRDQITFFDTTVACNLPYYEDAGLPPSDVRQADDLYRYRNVFFLEQLAVQVPDAVRRETREEAFQKGQRILREYQRLGYDVVTVPVMTVEERVKLIMKQIQSQK
ncbi:MAG: ATP-binding protein [Nanoarchaeota archaeon]